MFCRIIGLGLQSCGPALNNKNLIGLFCFLGGLILNDC